MSNFRVSNRYAVALMELAKEKNIFAKVVADIEMVSNTITASKELRAMLASPVVKQELKLSVLSEIFAKNISSESLNFLKFVVEKNREAILPGIVKKFIELKDEELGITEVKISSAVELSDAQKKMLQDKLEEFTKKKVRMAFSINPKIIGGFVARVADTIIDSSVSHKLELLRKKLLDENQFLSN